MKNITIQHYLFRNQLMYMEYVSMRDYFDQFFDKWGELPTFVFDGSVFRVTNEQYAQFNDERDKGIAAWLDEN